MGSLPWPWPMGKGASRGEKDWIICLRQPTIAQFRAPADVHDMAGDEARLVGKQKDTRIGNRIAVRAIPERMDFLQVPLGGTGIGLLGTPLPQHGRPSAGGADGIHPNAVFRIIER